MEEEGYENTRIWKEEDTIEGRGYEGRKYLRRELRACSIFGDKIITKVGDENYLDSPNLSYYCNIHLN